MADQLQLRGGSTAQHASFTGALREVTVDTDKKTVVVHDGTTAGGNPLLRQDLSNLPAGTIDNADINASAAIVDTKLATIATAGKVSNSATTATSANTASAIVARDGSGNFTAGTVTANLTGTASGNARLVQSAVQATTSGASIDFLGIPSWATRITVNFFQVSTSGTSPVIIQLGSGSYQTTGYASIVTAIQNATLPTAVLSTTGFTIGGATAPANRYGSVVLTYIAANGWVASGNSYESSSGSQSSTSGGIQFTSPIERVRLVATNGTDTFDGGVASITYEG